MLLRINLNELKDLFWQSSDRFIARRPEHGNSRVTKANPGSASAKELTLLTLKFGKGDQNFFELPAFTCQAVGR